MLVLQHGSSIAEGTPHAGGGSDFGVHAAANYNVAANNLYSQTDILGTTIALVDRTGNGTVWDTFNNVSLLPACNVHA